MRKEKGTMQEEEQMQREKGTMQEEEQMQREKGTMQEEEQMQREKGTMQEGECKRTWGECSTILSLSADQQQAPHCLPSSIPATVMSSLSMKNN